MYQRTTQILHQPTHEDEVLHTSNHQPMVVIQREYDIKERKLLKKEAQNASVSIERFKVCDGLGLPGDGVVTVSLGFVVMNVPP